MKTRSPWFLFGCLVLAPGVRAAAPTTVSIDRFMFTPMDITVAPGATVVWINHDQAPHAIVARDHAFASKALDTDDRYERQFPAEGDFSYVCSLHPFMVGIVHVRSSHVSNASAKRGD